MAARTWAVTLLTGTAALLLSTRPAAAQGILPAKPAAVVNGEAISLAEVDAFLKAQGPTAVQLTEAQKKQARREVLEMLLDDLLLTQFLRQNAPKVEPADVAKQFAELETSLKKDGKKLPDFLKETNQTEAQLRANVVKMLQWAGFVKARITDADVKRYYDENREFFDRVAVRCSHIVLRLPPTSSEAEKQTARTKLLALRQEIVAGKLDFGEAAKKNSQCPSAPQGGDLGYIPRKLMVDEAIAKAAYALKAGEVSDVVQTEFGVHLIKVTDRKPGQPSDFTKIQEDVRDTMVEELRIMLLSQLRKAAKIEMNLP